MGYGLGVDLGTSLIGAAISRDGETRAVPLGNDDPYDSDRPSLAGTETATVATTRAIGDAIASVLHTVTAAEGSAPDAVALTYPAGQTRYRREELHQAAWRAGLDRVTLVTDAEAAVTHYAAREQLAEGDLVAVYDLGGSTFSTCVAVVTGSGVRIVGTPEGVEWVAGADFDKAVMAHVDHHLNGAVSALDPSEPAAAIALKQLRRECTQAKESLSRNERILINVVLPPAAGPAGGPGRQRVIELTRESFEAMIRTPLESTVEALAVTLTSAGVAAHQLTRILLVGGSAQIPGVARMLSASLDREVQADPEPKACVALGAAVLAAATLLSPAGTAGPPAPAASATRTSAVRTSTARTSTARVSAAMAPLAILGPGVTRNRRVIAATAATALLIGGGSYLSLSAGSPPGDPVAESVELAIGRDAPAAGSWATPAPASSPKPASEPAARAPKTSRSTTRVTVVTSKSPAKPAPNSAPKSAPESAPQSEPEPVEASAPSAHTGSRSASGAHNGGSGGRDAKGSGHGSGGHGPGSGVVRVGGVCYDVSNLYQLSSVDGHHPGGGHDHGSGGHTGLGHGHSGHGHGHSRHGHGHDGSGHGFAPGPGHRAGSGSQPKAPIVACP